jgi:hypothetical protein
MDMGSPHQRDLTLVVPSYASQERIWILEPQGRNTFKIIVVCCPKNELKQPGPTRLAEP